jgi:hypothetical protein
MIISLSETHQDDPRHLSRNTKNQIPIHTTHGKAAATTAWTLDTEMIGITPNNLNDPHGHKALTADDYLASKQESHQDIQPWPGKKNDN